MMRVLRQLEKLLTADAIPANDIVDLVELVLKNNNFEFDGKHYL